MRWQAPQPVAPWTGTRICDRFGPLPVQAGPAGSETHLGDFDCLHLNVWCPAEGPGPRPVMVWVPGGGFMRGGAADPIYDGGAMARQGIVFVSIQYRLGVDGFMHFDDAEPNRGLQDQLAALRWVRSHIALFGGDPQQITVAGVSAGAGALVHLMGLPSSEGLFQRVILQSASLQTHDMEDAARVRVAMAGRLGVAPTREALAAVPLRVLTQALLAFLGNETLKQRWGLRPRNYFPVRPVVDGTLVQAPPLDAIRRRLADGGARWPVLLGCNAEEMRFYLVPGGEIDRVDEARLMRFVQDIDGGEALLARHAGAPGGPGERLCRIQSDYYYRDPAAALAQALREAGCDTLQYRFDWRSPLHGGRMGAAHAMEIPFVLGNTASTRAREFIGTDAPPALAYAMHDAWARFVRGEALPDWPRGGQQQRVLRVFGP
jgi:para-nitrobenzyl esterase